MEFVAFTATEDDSGRRLDKVARRLFPGLPLSAVYRDIRKGLVRLNGRRARADETVCAGDTIQAAEFLAADTDAGGASGKGSSETGIPGGAPPLTDIFRNEFVRVIDKPYDIPVQGGASAGPSLDKMIRAEYEAERGAASLSFRPGPLHRLDRKTTGLLVFSQSLSGARWFSQALRSRSVGKTYLAVLEGTLEAAAEWTEPVGRASPAAGGKPFRTSRCAPGGREARTTAVPLGHGACGGRKITLAAVEIRTGRTHQIRLHCAEHGLPLLGDTAYGAERIFGPQDFFLHAWRMTVPEGNPAGMPGRLVAPLPPNFRDMLEKCLPNFRAKPYNIKGYEGIL